MALTSGTKLGPYEILELLGAGGMGEVYRGRDARLGRIVAIKILSPHLSANAEAKQRFEREARAISFLNHPNICTLYDVGHQDGTDFLVVEYLQGETLAERLQKGPLPTAQVLKIGIDICEGLEKAHRSGIIHRDLKPGNIMLTKSGAKLLDFGLAKVAFPATADLTSSPTVNEPVAGPSGGAVTARGMIIGTFQYLSPEQLEGKEADVRSDIFSFGSVLYEMATGKNAFEGKSQASLIAAILEHEPAPISQVQPMAPPALERVVKTCLAKDPDARFQTVHDLKLQLEWIRDPSSQAGVHAPLVAYRKPRERLGWILAALFGIVAAAFAFGYFARAPIPSPTIRSYIKPPPDSHFIVFNGGSSGFAISPDGLRLAYVASGADGKPLLWIRPLDSLQAQPLVGTEGAIFPFWSPDSRFIGFFAGAKLKKIEASGGPPLTICDAAWGRGGTWNQEGTIVFAPTVTGPLFRVSAAGGTTAPVTALDPAKNESTHRWPYFLPDGHHFLYVAGLPFTPAANSTNAVMVGSLDSKESKLLLHTSSNAVFASGHILFLRQNTLVAQPFDPKRLEFTGDAFPVAEGVENVATRVQGIFSVSKNGVLGYSEAAQSGSRQLVWFDRTGKQIGAVPGTAAYSEPHLSPDGKKLAFTLESPRFDIWVYDIIRGVKARFTLDSAASAGNLSSLWSPDGRHLAYTSIRNGKYGIYQQAADGSTGEEVLLDAAPEQVLPIDWSPDGKLMVYWKSQPGGAELWMLPLGGARKPYRFLKSTSFVLTAYFSPDGKWLAYSSDESGRFEVYIRPFPGSGGKWLVSTAGGWYPHWRRDGKELFYLSPDDNKLMSAEIKTNGPNLQVGAVRPLFETNAYYSVLSGSVYDVAADGKRLIVANEPQQFNPAITLVVNWLPNLRK